jgi:hypothetical protein|uniref:Uncharacterized protein n=1 Tax=candidate division WOR-3 bacterium TaxID=2052148 RepID=A0A7C6AA33_UNCW3
MSDYQVNDVLQGLISSAIHLFNQSTVDSAIALFHHFWSSFIISSIIRLALSFLVGINLSVFSENN